VVKRIDAGERGAKIAKPQDKGWVKGNNVRIQGCQERSIEAVVKATQQWESKQGQ